MVNAEHKEDKVDQVDAMEVEEDETAKQLRLEKEAATLLVNGMKKSERQWRMVLRQ
jgi:26S proteasome regulatory subunit N3